MSLTAAPQSRREAKRELGRSVGAKPHFVGVSERLATLGLIPVYFANVDLSLSSTSSSLSSSPTTEAAAAAATTTTTAVALDWSSLPEVASVLGASLPDDRVERKRIQVENMLIHSMRMIQKLKKSGRNRPVVVDFCGGGGSVVIPLALLHPECDFVMIDLKTTSVQMARDRVAKVADGATNLRILEMRIEEFTEVFDLGLALHACGALSDYVLAACIRTSAAHVICSCCVGKIASQRQTPLSRQMQQVLSTSDYCSLIKAGDYGHAELAEYTALEKARRMCKTIVEHDRVLFAQENKYSCHLMLMTGGFSSVKNDMLIGFPAGMLSDDDDSIVQVQEPLEAYLFKTA